MGQIDGGGLGEQGALGWSHSSQIDFCQAATVGDFDKSLTQVMNALWLGGVGERMLVWGAAQGRRVVRLEGWWAEGASRVKAEF